MSRVLNENEGLCFVNEEGWAMMGVYDVLPKEVRARLQQATNNLCPACLQRFKEIVNDIPPAQRELYRNLSRQQLNAIMLMRAVSAMDRRATEMWEKRNEV